MVSIPGWSIQSAICTEGQTTLNWRRASGDLSMLQSYTRDLPKNYVVTLNGATGVSLSNFHTYGSDDYIDANLNSKQDTFVYLTTEFNRLGTINLTEAQSPPNTISVTEVVQSASQALSLATYPQYNFSLSTKLSINDIKEKFNFPSVKFNKVEWNVQSGQWLYDMVVYSDRTNTQINQGS